MTPLVAHKQKKIVIGAIAAGIMLYLSKFLRPYFPDNTSVLLILGCLPNFGLSLAMPFIYVSNRLRLNKAVSHFMIACTITLLLMVLNEIRDKYQSGRVFDWYDIYASFAGVIFAFFVFYLAIKRTYNANF